MFYGLVAAVSVATLLVLALTIVIVLKKRKKRLQRSYHELSNDNDGMPQRPISEEAGKKHRF